MEGDKARQRTANMMLRNAQAGHVTGRRTFGYDKWTLHDDQGRRKRVERRLNKAEAAVVLSIFDCCAAGACHPPRLLAQGDRVEREQAPSAAEVRPPCSPSPSPPRAR